MKSYIFKRLLKAVGSLFIVTSVAIVMVFLMIPRERVFDNDQTLTKLSGKKDQLLIYKNYKLKELGYIDFLTQAEICSLHGKGETCAEANSNDVKELLKNYENSGYQVGNFSDGKIYVSKDKKPLELILGFYSNLIKIDTKNYVQDPDNLNIERKIYIANDHNGMPAVQCSGCKHRYLLYLDGSFPFIHQNFIKLNFGISYPTFSGVGTLDVITNGQGEFKKREVTFETGLKDNSPINLHSCQYKPTNTLDKLDSAKFTSNYAKCNNNFQDPSMISVSYTFGIVSLLLSYLISIPAGIVMARNKGKLLDKLGIVYINIMIAVPSLAFIFFVRSLGLAVGLPAKFPQLGFGNILSYILPTIILALLSTSGLMIWVRRYMVDQTNADYVKFAKAKGLTEKEIFNRHIFKNAIIPLVNNLPRSIILSIGGAVITETVFAIPGMGKMLPDAIKATNNNMIITLTFIFTALSVFSLVLGDVLMAIVDPRIKLSSKGGSR